MDAVEVLIEGGMTSSEEHIHAGETLGKFGREIGE